MELTVKDLMETLQKMPEDAAIYIGVKGDLIGWDDILRVSTVGDAVVYITDLYDYADIDGDTQPEFPTYEERNV